MPRLVSWNVNGMRAALRKAYAEHLETLSPDVVMLQEIRAFPEQLPKGWAEPEGWHVTWHPAERPGYSGVATWTRDPHEVIGTGMDGPDPQGRVLHTRVGDLDLVNIYLPSGSSSEEAQERKDAFMERLMAWSEAFLSHDHPVILAGDLNIAHTEQDIHNARGNAKNSGFLPHERAWFTAWLEQGWTDLFRAHVGPAQGPYSWWSNRGRARELDRGWRIDYLLGNAAAAKRLKSASIHRPGGLDTSDHAPVIVDLD